jgi:oligopeptide transport system substrate-binding protein
MKENYPQTHSWASGAGLGHFQSLTPETTMTRMMQRMREISIYVLPVFLAGAMLWAVSFSTVPPADFTFNNDDEVKTVDPAKATGQPENRIINALFEGLLRLMPAPDAPPNDEGTVPMVAAAGCAELPEVSPDGKTYTFRIRPEAQWSNGDPVTAHDFAWSWRRILHPETAAEYAYQLYYVRGAKAYNRGDLESGDKIEVELDDRPDPLQAFPRGTMIHGVLVETIKPPVEPLADDASPEAKQRAADEAQRKWIHIVETRLPAAPAKDASSATAGAEPAIDWSQPGPRRAFSELPAPNTVVQGLKVEPCRRVLIDFLAAGGVRVVDDRTLVVELNNPTPFFNELVAFYPYFPVHRGCVERHGSPTWTKPANIVSNGPFTLQFRRIRDRIRLAKNPHYWDAANVRLNVIDALAVKYQTTSLNMFLNGQIDWMAKPPSAVLPELRKRDDFRSSTALIVYFYRLNTARKPLDDPRVRRALNMAMDKQAICDHVTKAGERPARHLVPPGLNGYISPQGPGYDVDAARKLLAEAGFPGGRGFPRLQVLFNTHDAHRDIAEVIQQQWKTNLGIDIELRNLEWGVYLDSVTKTDFDIARAGWVPDYSDPNTFLDMFLTGGSHNNTNWGNAKYDQLIEAAGAETDVQKRMQLFHEAEQILLDEQPIIPIYFYTMINLVHPRVKGFTLNAQDVHPLHLLSIDGSASAESNHERSGN